MTMLQERYPIDLQKVARALPALVEGFGQGPLRRQVDAYNELLATGHRSTRSATYIKFLLWTTKRLPSPHMALLNILSLWHSPEWSLPQARAMIARVFLLERLLRQAQRAGQKPTGYQDMLREPSALDRLIAELDIASPFTRVGRFSSHTPTDPTGASNKNYDVDWQWLGCRARADVKWFDTWVLKRSGADPLDALLALIRPDVKHMVYVSLDRGPFSDTMLIDAAEEALALYDAAVSGNGSPQIQVTQEDGKVSAMRPRRPYPQKTVIARVREVTVYSGDPRPDGSAAHPFVVSEVGSASADEDVKTIRRCLQDAAAQVPPSTSAGGLSCIVVGSANYQDDDDVEAALWGGPDFDPATGITQRVPGLFSPDTGETTLQHIHGVYFFSLAYHHQDDGSVRVRRYVRMFPRREGLSLLRRGLLHAGAMVLGRSTRVLIQPPEAY